MDLQNPPLFTGDNTVEEEFKKISRDKIIKFSREDVEQKSKRLARINGFADHLLRQCFRYERDLDKSWLEEIKKNPQHIPSQKPDSFFQITAAAIRLVNHLYKAGLCDIDYKKSRDRWYIDRQRIMDEGYVRHKRWSDEQLAFRKWRARTTKEEVRKTMAAGRKPWLQELEAKARMLDRQKLS